VNLCQTLTGSSRLTYDIGKEPEGGIHLRISKNSGGGFFSTEWVALQDIQDALAKNTKGKGITSMLLSPLFRGKSANTPGFLLAVLVHERILRPMPGKLRRHEFVDTSAFTEKVAGLLSGGVQAKGKSSAKSTAKKPPIKKKSAASKAK
jgi:hypothetical protein